MNTSESQAPRSILNPEVENLIFSPYTLRLMAFMLPPRVTIITARIIGSLSASYHTAARDVLVGFLFIIGAFLLAYNGRSPDLPPAKVGSFWKKLSQYWKGAIPFRIWLRKLEERVVSFIAGLAAFGIALNAMGRKPREFLPAFAFVYALSVVIFIAGQWEVANYYGFEAPLVALLVGLVIANAVGLPAWLDTGFRVEFYIKTAIVLLGATVPFTLIIWAGPVAILQASIVSLVTFGVIYLVATRLGLDRPARSLSATRGHLETGLGPPGPPVGPGRRDQPAAGVDGLTGHLPSRGRHRHGTRHSRAARPVRSPPQPAAAPAPPLLPVGARP